MLARSAATLVLHLRSGPKAVFAPQGRHIAPINVKFGVLERTADPLPTSNITFIRAEMWVWEYMGIHPRNCQNLEFRQ